MACAFSGCLMTSYARFYGATAAWPPNREIHNYNDGKPQHGSQIRRYLVDIVARARIKGTKWLRSRNGERHSDPQCRYRADAFGIRSLAGAIALWPGPIMGRAQEPMEMDRKGRAFGRPRLPKHRRLQTSIFLVPCEAGRSSRASSGAQCRGGRAPRKI